MLRQVHFWFDVFLTQMTGGLDVIDGDIIGFFFLQQNNQ